MNTLKKKVFRSCLNWEMIANIFMYLLKIIKKWTKKILKTHFLLNWLWQDLNNPYIYNLRNIKRTIMTINSINKYNRNKEKYAYMILYLEWYRKYHLIKYQMIKLH